MNRRTFVSRRASATITRRVLDAAARRETVATGRNPVRRPSQLAWQRDELALFLHFGVNTFTDREWGDGRESPAHLHTRRSTRGSGRARRARPACAR